MEKTYDVRIWSVRQRKDRGQTSAELRWKTGETPHSQLCASGRLARAQGRPGRTAVRRTVGEGSSTGPGKQSAPFRSRPIS
ncbi:integrase [Streptomyces azureus]|uniref:Integrase n=1 Tax=Streptomyces azureus TaxID=146537 RepID=A0A0K8PZ80_STRAJ|nr:integrase [Streptomyces azureus]